MALVGLVSWLASGLVLQDGPQPLFLLHLGNDSVPRLPTPSTSGGSLRTWVWRSLGGSQDPDDGDEGLPASGCTLPREVQDSGRTCANRDVSSQQSGRLFCGV